MRGVSTLSIDGVMDVQEVAASMTIAGYSWKGGRTESQVSLFEEVEGDAGGPWTGEYLEVKKGSELDSSLLTREKISNDEVEVIRDRHAYCRSSP